MAVTWAGAIVSVGLVAGLALWGYRLAVRDVSGVPVIRALEGPMRVAPDVPGGRAVAHQGLAVNRVAADGTAAPPAETVTLAPRPIDLAGDDRPVTPVLAPAPLPAALAPSGPLPLPEEEGTATGALDEEGSARAGLEAAPGADPLAEAVLAAVAGAPAGGAVAEGLPGAGGLRPRPRPARGPGGFAGDAMAEAALAAAVAALAPGAVREIDQATLAAGARLAQLGAYPDAAAARAAWATVAARFGALFAGRDRVLQTATRGGESFVRLRVGGFADEADSRRFCAALKAEDTPCTPVLLR